MFLLILSDGQSSVGSPRYINSLLMFVFCIFCVSAQPDSFDLFNAPPSSDLFGEKMKILSYMHGILQHG